jgi:xylan 1,4-beta-xylosidase
MFSRMGGARLATESDHAVALDNIIRTGVRGEPDVSALASLDGHKLCVMVWHYHDDDLAGPDAEIELTVDHLPVAGGAAKLAHYRIDGDHSNSFMAWKKMGSPQPPTPEQYAELEKAGHLATLDGPAAVSVEAGKAILHLTLPRQGVSLLELTW